MMYRDEKIYIISIAFALGTGALSGFLSRNGMKEYGALALRLSTAPGTAPGGNR